MLPIRLYSAPEVEPTAIEAACEALNEVTRELGQVAVLDYLGTWRSPHWIDQTEYLRHINLLSGISKIAGMRHDNN